MFNVTFKLRDSRNRVTRKTWVNTQALIADAITDTATLAGLLDAITELQLFGVEFTQLNEAIIFAGQANSN